jgi:hypothetical protein
MIQAPRRKYICAVGLLETHDSCLIVATIDAVDREALAERIEERLEPDDISRIIAGSEKDI